MSGREDRETEQDSDRRARPRVRRALQEAPGTGGLEGLTSTRSGRRLSGVDIPTTTSPGLRPAAAAGPLAGTDDDDRSTDSDRVAPFDVEPSVDRPDGPR